MAKISLNKLGEYMTAKGGRRRRIILDQQAPKQFKAARYNPAKKAIAQFLVDGNMNALLGEATKLSSDRSGTPNQIEARLNCAEAIEAFAKLDRNLGLADVEFALAPQHQGKMNIGGVDINIGPDVLVKQSKRGKAYWGAVKLYITKGDDYQLQEDGARYVTTLLHEWCASQKRPAEARTSLSLSVDVFRGRITVAPTARTKRLDDIEACCEEIAARWNQQAPPQDQ